MAVLISGVLKDGTGRPVQGCTITLKAKRTSATVIVNTVASENPDEAGCYRMEVEPGQYAVSLYMEGYPPSHAGDIEVRGDSAPGTLNDFLMTVTESDVRPEAIKHFEEMVREVNRQAAEVSAHKTQAGQSARDAEASAKAAAESEKNAAVSEKASADSARAAAQSQSEASDSAVKALASQQAAAASATSATASAQLASASEELARQSSETAGTHADSAQASFKNAAAARDEARTLRDDAQKEALSAQNSSQTAAASEKVSKEAMDEVRSLAEQVAADKNTIAGTASQVSTDAQIASTAGINAQESASDAAQSETNAENFQELARRYALNPEDNPVTGSDYSARHYSEKARKSAEEAASYNPAEALMKSLNLSDLADRAAAWLNVRPLGSTPLAGDPVNPYDATTMRWVENYVSGGGGTGPTMNGVQNFGVGLPTLWTSRAFIPAWSVVADGQLLNRVDWPELWAHAQMHTPIEDADWLADPTTRGAYSNGDGSTTFRVPDFNGVQSGSIPGLFGRGDQGGLLPAGNVYESAAPNISGRIGAVDAAGRAVASSGTGAFSVRETNLTNGFVTPSATGTPNRYTYVYFDANSNNPVYGRSTNQVWPNSFVGVWIIRASGGFTAANTLWSVINGDDAAPGAGVYVSGGTVRSEYHVAGSRVSSCAMRSLMHDDNVDGVFTVSNVKTGATTEWYFNENGSIRSNKGEVKFDGLIRSNDNNIVCGKGKAFVIPASEGTDANEMRMYNWGISGAIPTGAYVNSIWGKWYNGSYQFGGIRSASTALQRVQLNVNDGLGNGASYMFNPNGVAQAVQWQSTSDRRVKTCVETIPNPLEVMRSLRGYSWYYEPYGTQGFGFMSDEAEKYFPGAVKTTDDFEVEMPDGSKIDDVKSVDTYGIAAALHHEAILAMMDQIAELKDEIKKLKGE